MNNMTNGSPDQGFPKDDLATDANPMQWLQRCFANVAELPIAGLAVSDVRPLVVPVRLQSVSEKQFQFFDSSVLVQEKKDIEVVLHFVVSPYWVTVYGVLASLSGPQCDLYFNALSRAEQERIVHVVGYGQSVQDSSGRTQEGHGSAIRIARPKAFVGYFLRPEKISFQNVDAHGDRQFVFQSRGGGIWSGKEEQ